MEDLVNRLLLAPEYDAVDSRVTTLIRQGNLDDAKAKVMNYFRQVPQFGLSFLGGKLFAFGHYDSAQTELEAVRHPDHDTLDTLVQIYGRKENWGGIVRAHQNRNTVVSITASPLTSGLIL